ncbi:ABC transporter ATP-binding protein [Paramagnetospirillum caucaseum]|uniref:ABC transporter ATP-binding protein n=1 Tax=Paramagnetospirillum caucaseum TaxID=1244869 RepID=UPI0012698611|nr:ABC transporter ATP-binding protein [Paramagnetospirillum caucaseum]
MIGTVLEAVGIGAVFPLIKLLADPSGMGDSPVIAAIAGLFSLTSPNQVLAVMAIGMTAIFVLKNVLMAISSVINMRLRRDTEIVLARSLLRSYLFMPYAELIRRSVPAMTLNLTAQIPSFFANVVLGMVRIVTDLLIIIAILAVLFSVEPLMTFCVFSILALALALPLYLIRHRLKAWGAGQTELATQRQRCLQQCFGAIREIKVDESHGVYLQKLSGILWRLMSIQTRVNLVRDLPRMVIEVVMISTMTLVIVVMLLQDRSGGEIMAALGLFAAAGFRMIPQLNRLFVSLGEIRISLPAAELISRDFSGFIAEDERLDQGSTKADRMPFEREIRVESLSYAYPGTDRLVLDSVNLEINRGDVVGLVGPSGAGKSTLADILLGLLDPTSGQIRVDGQNIADDIRGWRRNLGTVPQDIFIIDDSLRRNVAFAVDSGQIDELRVDNALRMAQLDDLVASLPEGNATILGERGAGLSGGQRQRLGLARALYRDPEVLVLDEPTSALDIETEQEVSRTIFSLAGHKTIVIIAHRLSTLTRCDKIIFLEDGRVSAIGSFAELRQINPRFARLVAMASHGVIDEQAAS